MSRTREEAKEQAAEFLSVANGLIDAAAKRAVHDEADYLWNVFPSRARTTEKYKELMQVLLAQAVDTQWYFDYPRYGSDQDVREDETLFSFRRGTADFEVHFVYVRYYEHVLMRIPNSMRLRYRRLVNHPGRYTQGLKTTRCKKALMGLINQISEDITGKIASRQPFKVMVNSVLRTEVYQNTLASLGYIAPRNSAHLNGYAVDLEKLWYEKHDRLAHEALTDTLNNLFERGVINLIEEETHWHVCLHPPHIPAYETLALKWVRNRR